MVESFFIPGGKADLCFLKSSTELLAPKQMDVLNDNIHYRIFCGIRIRPDYPMTDYKLIDNILLELSQRLRM